MKLCRHAIDTSATLILYCDTDSLQMLLNRSKAGMNLWAVLQCCLQTISLDVYLAFSADIGAQCGRQ